MDNKSAVKKKCLSYSQECAAFYLAALFSATMLGFSLFKLAAGPADPLWISVATSVFALWAPAPRPPPSRGGSGSASAPPPAGP